MMLSEAIVFFDRSLSKDFPNRMLQAGQLASKMRFSAAQWIATIETGAWLKYARHANAMAKRLEKGLGGVPGVSVMYPVQANAVYADMPVEMQTSLRSRSWEFFTFLGERGVRLMCAWDTTEQDVDQLIADMRAPG
jgi:threonine aldolase